MNLSVLILKFIYGLLFFGVYSKVLKLVLSVGNVLSGKEWVDWVSFKIFGENFKGLRVFFLFLDVV